MKSQVDNWCSFNMKKDHLELRVIFSRLQINEMQIAEHLKCPTLAKENK